MKQRQVLAVLLILALLFRVIFAIIVPIFEKPDEKSHFEYINFIVENKKLPKQKEGQYGAEFFQPPFYHYIVSFILKFVRIFTIDLSYQVLSMRLVSVFVSMFTLYIVYKIASLLFKNRNLILGCVIFAAFLPSHINMNSSVTNANFADFLSTLIIYMIILFIIKGEDSKRIFLLGIIAGISLITRLSILPIIATIPFAFIVKQDYNIKKAIKPIIIIAIIALIISSWFFIRNFMLYGDFLGINAMKLASSPDAIKFNLAFVARLLGWTFITFWASFGRTNGIFIGNLTTQIGIIIFFFSYLLLLLFSLSAIYGLFFFFKKYMKDKGILSYVQKKAFIIMVFHLILLSSFFISFNFYDFQPQGRLFFPAIAAISVFFTLGMYNLFDFYHRNRLFIPVYLVSFILVNIASIVNVLLYY